MASCSRRPGPCPIAHAAGLLVHPYTFRAENTFLPADFRTGTDPNAFGDIFSEYELFFDLGVDGVFADQADIAVYARAAHRPGLDVAPAA